MPTITTTVTSAEASGVTTTCTTTEATPDSGTTSSNCSVVEAVIASWYAGTLKADKLKWWSPNVAINFGKTGAPGLKSYTMATFDQWIDELALYNMHDMEWQYSPMEGGCLAEWTVTSMEVKATGAKTGPLRCVIKYNMTGGVIDDIELITSHIAEMEELTTAPNVGIVRALIEDWGAGVLNANKAKYFSPDVAINGGSSIAPGFGKYGYDTFQQWMDELTQYNFPGMAWEFSAGPKGSVYGEWSCDNFNVKRSGATVGATGGVNRWDFNENGLVVAQTFNVKKGAAIDAMFTNPNVGIMEAIIGEWGAGTLTGNKAKYYATNCAIDGGSTIASGFKKYNFSTFDNWLTELTEYDFQGMTWDFNAGTGDIVYARWTATNIVRKATGASTGPMDGANVVWFTDGKVAKYDLAMLHLDTVEALFK